ncbi:hypothetical protein [Leptolinea tardivitalis]|uniref:hypothetical protein n=1 Tax=Leptolinea tardivitalis TaxID=229920 RepID=UPI00130DF67E|nr:hypothetical protein [Leptolinea tardivitalis]
MQKKSLKSLPVQSTSAAASALPSAACQQAVCGKSALPQTFFSFLQSKYNFSPT